MLYRESLSMLLGKNRKRVCGSVSLECRSISHTRKPKMSEGLFMVNQFDTCADRRRIDYTKKLHTTLPVTTARLARHRP